MKTKKKRKWLLPLVLILVLLIGLLAGAGVLIVPHLIAGEDVTAAVLWEDVRYQLFDKKHVTAIAEEAEALAQAGDPQGALDTINDGLERYPDAELLLAPVEEYTQQLREQEILAALDAASALAEQEDYSGAIAAIQEALGELGEDTRLTDALETYDGAYAGQVSDDALTAAEELARQGEYLAALETLEAAMDETEEEALQRQLETYEEKYVQQITEQVELLLLEKRYEEAAAMAKDAQKERPKNANLKKLVEFAENAAPAYLMDVAEPYLTSYGYNADTPFSMGGKSYTHGFTTLGNGDAPVGRETFFNIGKKYAELTFTAGIVEDDGYTVSFSIYADGEYIYGFEMESGDLPTTHTVDIVDCEQLVFCAYDGRSQYSPGGTYGFADIKVTSNLSGTMQTTRTNTLEDGEVYLLNEIDPYLTPGGYSDIPIFKMNEESYLHGFTCRGNGDEGVGSQTFFNLEGKYTKLSFIAGNVTSNGRTATITVSADGTPILSFQLADGALPEAHTVDVTGCNQLVFSIYDGTKYQHFATYGIADIRVLPAS